MKLLLVKPHPELNVAKKLQAGFLHLEPLELEIVAGGVSSEDQVKILDLSVEKDPYNKFIEVLLEYSPDMLGFSAYSTTFHIVKELAVIAKKSLPEIVVLIGAIHATLLPEDYFVDQVDLIIRGEGGTVIGEIIRRFKNKEELYFGDAVLSPKDPEFVKKAESAPPVYPDVHAIPRPRRDLVDRSKYFCVWTHSETNRLDTMFPRVASMRTSIGCPFSCSFCVIHHVMNKKYLQRDPEDVVDEIAGLKESHIYFVDDEMFINPDRVKKIAELLKERGIKKKYISWARSDTIVKNPELFKLWKEVGLDVVYVGLESMDEEKLKEYDKRVGIETNRKAISIIKELGIMLHAAFIVHPDFTANDFRLLESEVAKLTPAEVTFTVLSPSPGTAYWHQNKDRFICDPFKNYDCMHTVLPTRLPLRRFYQHFGRLSALALRANPLRVNKTKVHFKDFLRAIIGGTKYIFSLYLIYKDYPAKMWLSAGDNQLSIAKDTSREEK